MKYSVGAALIVCLLGTHFAWSQAICGFDALHKKSLHTDASYRRMVADNKTRLQYIIAEQKARRQQPSARVTNTNAPPYIIPVVVHVLHTGGAEGSPRQCSHQPNAENAGIGRTVQLLYTGLSHNRRLL